jgi:hypothetical protein
VYNSIRTDRDRREAARVCLELVVLKFCNYLRLHEKVIHCTTINESFFLLKKLARWPALVARLDLIKVSLYMTRYSSF